MKDVSNCFGDLCQRDQLRTIGTIKFLGRQEQFVYVAVECLVCFCALNYILQCRLTIEPKI